MLKIKNCIDCKVKLTDKNRSKHQPDIRCSTCFTCFATSTTKTLEDMISTMKKANL